jgi:hypothetical protein
VHYSQLVTTTPKAYYIHKMSGNEQIWLCAPANEIKVSPVKLREDVLPLLPVQKMAGLRNNWAVYGVNYHFQSCCLIQKCYPRILRISALNLESAR